MLHTARFLVAIHEAGHTAPWLAAGRRIQSVRITDDGDGCVRPLTRWTSDRLLCARAALAGPAAEARYLGKDTRTILAVADSHLDQKHALQYLRVQEIPSTTLAEVDLLVSVHWRLIMTTALWLTTHGKLRFRQLEALRRMYREDRSPWL